MALHAGNRDLPRNNSLYGENSVVGNIGWIFLSLQRDLIIIILVHLF